MSCDTRRRAYWRALVGENPTLLRELNAGDDVATVRTLERIFNDALRQARRAEAAGTAVGGVAEQELTERLFADMRRLGIARPVHGDDHALPAPASVAAYAAAQRRLAALTDRGDGRQARQPVALNALEDFAQLSAPAPSASAGSGATPGSNWSLPHNERGWSRPLSIEDGEVGRFNSLDRRYNNGGLAALAPTEADQLYEYQARRWQTQLGRLAGLQNLIAEPADVETELYDGFFRALAETGKRRVGLAKLDRDRAELGWPSGGYPDDRNGVFEQADQTAIAMLRARRLGQASDAKPVVTPISYANTGAGRLENHEESAPLVDATLPPEQVVEPLYIRVAPGMAASGLRRSLASCCYPVLLYNEEDPPMPGSVVLNWGDAEWRAPQDLVTLNSPAAVAQVRDKVAGVALLGDLAPHSTRDPVAAVELLGATFVGKARFGQGGSGVGFIYNPDGDTASYSGGEPRPLGHVPAGVMNSYELYQEFLPHRDEYRALLLDGQVTAFYARQPAETTVRQPRPTSFDYAAQEQMPAAALQAAREAMERAGLDFGGVDLAFDRDSGRWLVFEINSAPGLSSRSLDLLYGAVQNRLQGRCGACGRWIGNGAHECSASAAANVSGLRGWVEAYGAYSETAPARLATALRQRRAQTPAAAPQTTAPALHPDLAGVDGQKIVAGWVEQAQALRMAGKKPPYRYEGALGQAAADFGLELEFAGADAEGVAAAMFDAGLAAHPQLQDHGHLCANCASRWRVERDGSITQSLGLRFFGGEVVSPVLSDSGACWEELEQVTGILRRDGARNSAGAGQHVHVSTAAYGSGKSEYLLLAQAAARHEDLLYRLAAPGVPLHRGLLRDDHEPFYYARPVANCLTECYRRNAQPTVRDVLAAFGAFEHDVGHYYALNLEHVPAPSALFSTGPLAGAHSRVEFRLPNATFDPVQIQTNARIAAGLVSIALGPQPRLQAIEWDPGAVQDLGWHHNARREEEQDLDQLGTFLDQTLLPEDACVAIVDTFLRGRWQPADLAGQNRHAAIAAYDNTP